MIETLSFTNHSLLLGQGARNGWLAHQLVEWRGVEVTVTDVHEPFSPALATRLPAVTAVADPFLVVGAGTRVGDHTVGREGLSLVRTLALSPPGGAPVQDLL